MEDPGTGLLKQSEKPQAVLLNMIAPAVLKLVQATTTP
jgi:hypothetical protein